MHIRELDRLEAVGDQRAADTRKPSRLIWEDCPAMQLRRGLRDGLFFRDDFLGSYVQAANVAAASTTLNDPWAAFTDATAGATIASGVDPTDATGTMVLASTTAQEGVHVGLHTAKNSSAPIEAPTATNRIWLEARLKVLNVTVNEIALFFGLMERGRLVTLGTIATLGAAVAAVDHVGFLKHSGGTTGIKTSHGNGTSTILDAAAGTLAADTYTTLGLKWDGATFRFYQDNVLLATQLALGATQFPAGENMAVHFGMISGSGGGDITATIDWVQVAFERVK